MAIALGIALVFAYFEYKVQDLEAAIAEVRAQAGLPKG